MEDFYKILGVSKNASQEEIKTAYRKLASKNHPDKGGDTATFQKIQAAYDILGDPEKRAQYDDPRFRQQENLYHRGFQFNQQSNDIDIEQFFRHFGGMGGAFEHIFGGRKFKNKDLTVKVSITLEEVYSGKNITANFRLPSGRDEIVSIKIPCGIQDQTNIRLDGLGDDSISDLPRGNLNLIVEVIKHPNFQRQGIDLILDTNISVWDAMLGNSIDIETIEGKTLSIKIPPGTQHEQILSIPGFGLPEVDKPNIRGRLLLRIRIEIPRFLSEEQKNLIKQIVNT